MKNTLPNILLVVISTLTISAEVFKPVLEVFAYFLENCQFYKDDPSIQFAFLTVPEYHENPDGQSLGLPYEFYDHYGGHSMPVNFMELELMFLVSTMSKPHKNLIQGIDHQ